ncbi:MAG: hypothetical protein ACREM9_11115, partial [Gemmatimonadales bacterium]
VRLAVEAGDTAGLRELAEYYVTHTPAEVAEIIRWLVSAAYGTEVAPRLRAGPLESFIEQSLRRVVTEGTSFGLGLDDAERAIATLLQRSASGAERERTLMLQREFLLNRGRPGEALRVMRELITGSGSPAFRQERLREMVYYALYWDGDEEAGRRAADELDQTAAQPLSADTTELAEQLRARCVVEQWRLAHQDRRAVRRSIEVLRATAESMGSRREAARTRACAVLLEAMLYSSERHPVVLSVLDRLDSLHVAALPDLRNEDVWVCAGNLVAGLLRAAHGDLPGALAAIHRHGEPGDQKILLSTYLREEGRLAALAGDTGSAVRAYRQFLALRSQPEPRLASDRARVRAELDGLIRQAAPDRTKR